MNALDFPSIRQQQILQVMTGKHQTMSEIEFALGVIGITVADIHCQLMHLTTKGCVDRSKGSNGRYRWYQTPYGSELCLFILRHGTEYETLR